MSDDFRLTSDDCSLNCSALRKDGPYISTVHLTVCINYCAEYINETDRNSKTVLFVVSLSKIELSYFFSA